MKSFLPNHFLEKMDPAERRKLGKAGMTAAEALAKAVPPLPEKLEFTRGLGEITKP